MNAVDPPTMPAIKAITFSLPGSDPPCRELLDDAFVLFASAL